MLPGSGAPIAVTVAGGRLVHYSWVNDNDPVGGAVFGVLGAATIGSLVAGARHLIHALRQKHRDAS
ncbi:hypothetical protein [Streptomyces apocyni]|uniref:hypothetical protein n=1 Tax=Streptomyces apocyni TaxID=2654677 RepID=UPI0012EA520F|nr:hypothetical protein [Streptomyces apocyni]